MPRRRKRNASATEDDDPETAAMKSRQRALQGLAISLRGQGRVYRKQPFRLAHSPAAAGDAEVEAAAAAGGGDRVSDALRIAGTATRIKERIDRRCDCVIIPIFWESRAAEKNLVRVHCFRLHFRHGREPRHARVQRDGSAHCARSAAD